MKLAKWNEKTTAFLDSLLLRDQSKNGVIYSNTNRGCYFADKSGHWARFLPDSQIISDNPKNESRFLPTIFENAINASVLADSVTFGKAGGKKCRKFQHGDTEVYVYERLLRDFPKNADFYISGATKPVVVSLWENGILHEIGIVMPFYFNVAGGFIPA